MKKKAFTLLELMIVIVIIGVVYTLAIQNFSQINDKSAHLTLSNLKAYLLSITHETSAKLLCLDDCSRCSAFADGVKIETFENFLDASVISYRYEFLYGYTPVEQKVCFSYEVLKNGVGDQVLVGYKNRFYDFSSYFKDTQIYDSLEDARSAKNELAKEVTQ